MSHDWLHGDFKYIELAPDALAGMIDDDKCALSRELVDGNFFS